jgi:hypothetical protein
MMRYAVGVDAAIKIMSTVAAATAAIIGTPETPSSAAGPDAAATANTTAAAGAHAIIRPPTAAVAIKYMI